jgi:DNA transformation protein
MAAFDADAISELFQDFGRIDVRRMFSGAGLFADGVFFGIAFDDVIYLKADETTKARFEAEGCARFSYQTSVRTVETNLWRLPERLYDDPEELAQWARQAHDIARAASVRKKRTKKTARASRPPVKRVAKKNVKMAPARKTAKTRTAKTKTARKPKSVRPRARSSGGTRNRVRR